MLPTQFGLCSMLVSAWGELVIAFLALTWRGWRREHWLVGHESIVDAIDKLRDRARGRELARALATLYDWLDAHYSRKPHHSEHRQVTVIKAFRNAAQCHATERKQAEAWLHRIYQNVLKDWYRKQKNDPLSRVSGDDARQVLESLEQEPAETKHDDAALERHEGWLFERLDEWLLETIPKPAPRQKARTQAEVAWERHVRECKPPEIAGKLPNAPSTAALYKWIERGREKVLLPMIDAVLTRDLTPSELAFCETLAELLRGARRADAGKPRPKRRVSSSTDSTSVQYGGASPDSTEPRGSHD